MIQDKDDDVLTHGEEDHALEIAAERHGGSPVASDGLGPSKESLGKRSSNPVASDGRGLLEKREMPQDLSKSVNCRLTPKDRPEYGVNCSNQHLSLIHI